jgi:RNA polymerase I-specific transcription initiation factor RRN7
MFLRYLRELALPLEVHIYAKNIVSLLRLDFSFPTKANTPLNNPDTLLIASIVVATKLLYPFDGIPRFSNEPNEPSNLHLNWDRWAEIFQAQQGNRKNSRQTFEKMSSADVHNMTEGDMDHYLDWYQESQITPREDTRDLERLFPLIHPTRGKDGEGDDEEKAAVEARIQQIREHVEWNQHISLPDGLGEEDGVVRPGGQYERYEKADDLSGPAKLFHEMAAEYSGLSVEKLVHAIYRLEQKIMYWQRADKQGVPMDAMEGVKDGVDNRNLARMMSVRGPRD